MTIDTIYPTRRERPQRRRRRAASARKHSRLHFRRHRASARLRVPHAAEALNAVMQEADIFKIGRVHYLVAPLNAALLDTLIVAAGAAEDEEEDDPGGEVCDPVLNGRTVDDEEDDPGGGAIDDEPHDEINPGEPSLGWANHGPQLRLDIGYSSDRESDGDCDAEPDHENEPDHDNEPSLAGINAGMQEGIDPLDREGDPCDRGEPDDDDYAIDGDGSTPWCAAV